jgi:hypothetical protein
MATTYRKTAQGADEIQTRARRLAPRLRQALIVVDGRKTDAELAALLPQAAESLAALLEGGYIEPVAVAAPSPAPAGMPAAVASSSPAGTLATTSAPTSAPTSTTTLATAQAAPATVPFETTRRELLRAFIDRVGPAGESLAMRMERARSADELRALLPQAVQLVGTIAGRQAAAEFATRAERV